MHIEDLASRLQKYSEIGMKIFLFKLFGLKSQSNGVFNVHPYASFSFEF